MMMIRVVMEKIILNSNDDDDDNNDDDSNNNNDDDDDHNNNIERFPLSPGQEEVSFSLFFLSVFRCACVRSFSCTELSDRRKDEHRKICLLLACLLCFPATCYCIPGSDLLRQVYVLPH